MVNLFFAYEYEAVFCKEEHGCAKHTHIKMSKVPGLT